MAAKPMNMNLSAAGQAFAWRNCGKPKRSVRTGSIPAKTQTQHLKAEALSITATLTCLAKYYCLPAMSITK